MLRLAGLMITIGLADSINPSTIAPALYLATGRHARLRVAEFTLSVFLVYLAGGVMIALGPGQLLRQVLPHPDYEDRAVGELVAGVVLLVAAALTWGRRGRLQQRRLPVPNARRSSSVLLGATITAIELPTAFPYFAAIAAVVGSKFDPARQFGLLLLFNICFVLPLVAIVLTLVFAGHRADRRLANARRFVERKWPLVLAILIGIVGLLALFLGATGLAATKHGPVARFFRHLRHTLHLSH
jgi:cytochrome c biogenesis protein CcdA